MTKPNGKSAIIALAALVTALPMASAAACEVDDAYIARLGTRDHYNSNGVRLMSAAAIIRQDRANYHLFGKSDGDDEGDTFFASKENRARMETLLENGRADAGVKDTIVNSTPLVHVKICKDGSIMVELQ